MNSLKIDNSINRIYWMDNLRSFMVFLVIVLHAAIIYEKNLMGASWWIVVEPANNDFYGIVFIILNIFVMATIFFISGFFTPMSLEKNQNWKFVKKKFRRLIIPWIIGALFLLPCYKILFLYSRELPQENWISYLYWNNEFSQNWLWYLPILFSFQVIYMLISKIKILEVNFKASAFFTIILSILYNFSIRYFGFYGWTKTILFDFENDRLLVYFLVFLLGGSFYKSGKFRKDFTHKQLDIFIHCLGWLHINLYIFQMIYFLINPNQYIISKFIDLLIYRSNFILSLAYLVYVVVTVFLKFFNKNNTVSTILNKNTYYVYIIHVVIMGINAILLQRTFFPAILKFILLVLLTYSICILIIEIVRLILKVIRSKYHVIKL